MSTYSNFASNNEHQGIVSYEAPVSVPRLSVQLLISADEPENEALRCLLTEPPTDSNQLNGKRFVILATDSVEELKLTVPYKFIAERGGMVHLVSTRFEMSPAKFGTQYLQMRATHIMTDDIRNAGAFVSDEPVIVNGNIITSRHPIDLPPLNTIVEVMEKNISAIKVATTSLN